MAEFVAWWLTMIIKIQDYEVEVAVRLSYETSDEGRFVEVDDVVVLKAWREDEEVALPAEIENMLGDVIDIRQVEREIEESQI